MSDDAETETQPRDASPAPWTVKGMPREQRDAINAAARRADMTVAEFIWDACDAKIKASRVLFPAPQTELIRHPEASLPSVDRASHVHPDSPADHLTKLVDLALRLSVDEIAGRQTDVLKAARSAVAARLKRLTE
jgi:hypothetical protein